MSKLTRKSSGLILVVIFGVSVAIFVGLFQAEGWVRQINAAHAETIVSDYATASVAVSSEKPATGDMSDVTVNKSVNTSLEPHTTDAQAVILKKLRAARPDLTFTDVKPSVIPGVYEVVFNGGGKIYSSASGEYFIAGEVYQVQSNGLVNMTELARTEERSLLMDKLDVADMIVFSPAKETKASIYVFTDVDCGYCRLMHREMANYHELGIEVRYLAFPRAGLGSESYNKVASAWCAKDKLNAMNLLKAGQSIPNNVCADNPVAAQYNLGQQMGVNGTPAIILESGELIPGFVKASELARRLNL